MIIPEDSRQNLFKYLGSEADVFLSRVDGLLKKYTVQWQLSELVFMPTNTVNLLFSCQSSIYGLCVLKVCIPGPEVATEINCLRAYDAQAYVKLWDYHLEDNILLLERVIPGSELWEVKDDQERARLFANTFKNLQMISIKQTEYPTYQTWLEKVRKNLVDKGDLEEVLFYLDEALKVYEELKRDYPNDVLLHGDLHQENLLLNEQNKYIIIDPKGVVDMPVMEVARFLLNETPCEEKELWEMVAIISNVIEIPEIDIIKSLFIDATLSNSWTLEEYVLTSEAFEKNKQEALRSCQFFYQFLNKSK